MRKKLFAVIMSAMMMITFMPSMAFATISVVGEPTWDTDYQHAVVYYSDDSTTPATTGSTYVAATSSFNSATGLITSSVTVEGTTKTITYYDLDNAYIATDAQGHKATTVNADTYLSKCNNDGINFNSYNPLGNYITFEKPSYATATVPTTTTATVLMSTLTGDFTVAQTQSKKPYVAYNDGTYEIPVKATKAASPTNAFVGQLKAQSVEITTNVVGAFGFNYAKLNLDSLISSNKIPYKGSYAVEVKTPGVTAEYKVVKAAGVDVPVAQQQYTKTAPTIKELGDYDIRVKFTNAAGTKTSAEKTYAFEVTRAKVVVGLPSNFVVAKGQKIDKKTVFASSVVTKEDQDEYNKILDKYVTVTLPNINVPNTAVTPIYNDAVIDLSANARALAIYQGDTALEAFESHYELTNAGANTEYVVVNAKAKTNTWVKVTSAKKTFKAKKGKLAKNMSFTIKDKVRFGKLSFEKVSGNKKITVNSKGKVTAKKGLKKGTYKVTVVEELDQTLDNGVLWSDVYKVRTFTIKVK